MKLSGFRAESDLVGRRVRLYWTLTPNSGETLSNRPRVRIRRKQRDFEFPAPTDPDPFQVFDSNLFPAPGDGAIELPAREERNDDGGIALVTATSAARNVAGQLMESARLTVRARLATDRSVLDWEIEFLDYGNLDSGLIPGKPLYYQLETLPPATPEFHRSTVTPTEVYLLGKKMYELLPGVSRRHDTALAAQLAETAHIREGVQRTGQLRRYLDLFGVAFDSMRSTAEGLRNLRDVDNSDHRYLSLLAAWIGWDLSFNATVPTQRHEIRYAPALYRVTGTHLGCEIWVHRLTGWNPRIKEFARNVFLTNHVQDPNDPGDNGSRTVDTRDTSALAAMGTFEDRVDYTYDTAEGDGDWFSAKTIGIFVRPPAGEDAALVARKKKRLLQNAYLFVPCNIRVVVVIETELTSGESGGAAPLLQGSQDN